MELPCTPRGICRRPPRRGLRRCEHTIGPIIKLSVESINISYQEPVNRTIYAPLSTRQLIPLKVYFDVVSREARVPRVVLIVEERSREAQLFEETDRAPNVARHEHRVHRQ